MIKEENIKSNMNNAISYFWWTIAKNTTRNLKKTGASQPRIIACTDDNENSLLAMNSVDIGSDWSALTIAKQTCEASHFKHNTWRELTAPRTLLINPMVSSERLKASNIALWAFNNIRLSESAEDINVPTFNKFPNMDCCGFCCWILSLDSSQRDTFNSC